MACATNPTAEAPILVEARPPDGEPPPGLPDEEDEISPLGVPADEDEGGDPELPGFPDKRATRRAEGASPARGSVISGRRSGLDSLESLAAG